MFKVTVRFFSEVNPEDFDTLGEMVILAEENHEGFVLGRTSVEEKSVIESIVDADMPRAEFDRVVASLDELVYNDAV